MDIDEIIFKTVVKYIVDTDDDNDSKANFYLETLNNMKKKKLIQNLNKNLKQALIILKTKFTWN